MHEQNKAITPGVALMLAKRSVGTLASAFIEQHVFAAAYLLVYISCAHTLGSISPSWEATPALLESSLDRQRELPLHGIA